MFTPKKNIDSIMRSTPEIADKSQQGAETWDAFHYFSFFLTLKYTHHHNSSLGPTTDQPIQLRFNKNTSFRETIRKQYLWSINLKSIIRIPIRKTFICLLFLHCWENRFSKKQTTLFRVARDYQSDKVSCSNLLLVGMYNNPLLIDKSKF